MTFQDLKAKALANPKGQMVQYEKATRIEDAVIGAWDGTDCNRDILRDLLYASQKLSSIPSHLIGDVKTLGVLFYTFDQNLFPNWFELLPLFKDGGNLWEGPKFLRYDTEADPGIVLLVGSEGDVVYIDTR